MAQLLATLLLVGMLSAPSAKQQSPENYCEQEESWQEWQELAAKHPDDQSLQTLHALRIGICIKVERNELSVAQGTAIFEKARQALLMERQEVARKQKRSSPLLLP
jgi:hypothetical protein